MKKIISFPRGKLYKDFGPLLADLAKEYPDTPLGLTIIFDPKTGPRVFPVCDQANLALAGAMLLRMAAEE